MTPTLLEVADGAPADVRLGDLVHRDRGHDPGRDTRPLERVLERQAVHDRREHADVVAGRPVHATRRRGQAAEDVAAADDDPDLDAEAVDLGDLAGDERADRRVDAVLTVPEQRLAGQLEQDPPVAQRRDGGGGLGHSSSPSAKRVKRRTRMFSPIVAIFSVIRSRTVRSSSRNGWS